MPLLHLVVLAVVQGVTEFLPISSSAHLILVPWLTGWQDQGLEIDIAVHAGTLLAVVLYFSRDIIGILAGLTQRGPHGTARLAGQIVVATIPVGGAGYALHELGPDMMRSAELIAWTTIGFGLLLWIADRSGMTVRRLEHMSWGGAIVIGLAQVLALLPGTSRSGITMTAARMLGFDRESAARFSMLLSIPVIAAASLLTGLDLQAAGDLDLTRAVVTAAALAFVSALVAIWGLMAWLRRATFTPFVIYRLLLGGALLWWIYA